MILIVLFSIHSVDASRVGSSASSHGSSSDYARESSSSAASSGRGSGIFKSESVRTEEVSQDISDLGARSHGGFQVVSESSLAEGSSGGRRRMKSQQDGEAARPDLITGISGIERVAQGRGGFQTSTLDLGSLNRQNVDEEVRRSSGGRISGGSGYESQSSAGHQQGGSSTSSVTAGSSKGSSSSSSQTYSASSHSSSGSSNNQHSSGSQQGYVHNQQSAAYGDDGEYVDEYDEYYEHNTQRTYDSSKYSKFE